MTHEHLKAQKTLKAFVRTTMKHYGVPGLTVLCWDYEARDSCGWKGFCDDWGIGHALARYLERRRVRTPSYIRLQKEAADDERN